MYTAEDLVNDTEYCFEITSVYDEGESVPSATVCAVPQGPFQVNPQTLNFDELMEGDYFEQIVTIQNFDTLDADFDISSVELSNIDAALDLVLSTFEDGTLGDFTNIPDLGEEWKGPGQTFGPFAQQSGDSGLSLASQRESMIKRPGSLYSKYLSGQNKGRTDETEFSRFGGGY